MESNREEAQHCLARARTALRELDLDKARKLTKKSIQLFPSEAAERRHTLQPLRRAPSAALVTVAHFRASMAHDTRPRTRSSSRMLQFLAVILRA